MALKYLKIVDWEPPLSADIHHMSIIIRNYRGYDQFSISFLTISFYIGMASVSNKIGLVQIIKDTYLMHSYTEGNFK